MESTPKRPRHLMDPANPRPPVSSGHGMSISHVQRWVMSSLAVTTILHFAVGLVIAAIVMPDDRVDARVGLNVIAAVVGVLGVVAARLIHQKSPLTPWLLAGAVPGLVGLWLTFR